MTGYKHPEIRIKDAWLLRTNASQYLHELWAKEGDVLADDKWMEKRVSEYQKAWQPYEKKIVEGMCDIYDLRFKQNMIDVYIAPWFSAFSDPLVIGVQHDPDVFIDLLAHELLHRLFTCNNLYDIDHDKKLVLGKDWRKMFGADLDFGARIHIPVHAGLKALFLDILQEPHRLERDIKSAHDNIKEWGSDYAQAWDYVEKHDYKKINQNLKKSYKNFSEAGV